MLWTAYAVAHSLFRAIFAEINRLYRIDAWQLTFVHAVCALVFLLPFTPLMRWPADPSFYMAAGMVALIITIGVVIQLSLSSAQSGRISAIAVPFEALGAFAIWLALEPAALDRYAQDPLRLVGVGAAFLIAIFGLVMLRRHDISGRTLMIVAPLALTYAVAGVVTKVIVPAGTGILLPALLAFVMINYIMMAVVMGGVLVVKRRIDDTIRARATWQAGLLTGMLGLMGYATFVVAVVMAPNPGYVSLTAVLVPVWLFIYHHAKHREDHSSAAAALLIIISVMILVLSTL